MQYQTYRHAYKYITKHKPTHKQNVPTKTPVKPANINGNHKMRDVLHWLPFPQRISYRIASLVWRCLSSCQAGRPHICASSAVLSPHVQAVVHSGPLLTVIWWSHSPALRQCRPVHFLWLVQKPGMDFQQI